MKKQLILSITLASLLGSAFVSAPAMAQSENSAPVVDEAAPAPEAAPAHEEKAKKAHSKKHKSGKAKKAKASHKGHKKGHHKKAAEAEAPKSN